MQAGRFKREAKSLPYLAVAAILQCFAVGSGVKLFGAVFLTTILIAVEY